ncbi:MAG: nicotinate (nicotinamide) nucleotide adenylyltransferase [Calditrichaeota bacterium]|nr:nicotinate (nicotinamide) nucleotide adenylyltransferase [Calditrichota bacterium]
MNKPDSDNWHKIGLFGGTFDPIHHGHLIVAEWLQHELQLKKVFFIPNYIHPFRKRSDIVQPEHRLKMTRLAIRNFDDFEVSDFEIRKGGVSYTIDTIEHFKERFPNARIYYFIGVDNLSEFHKWRRYRDILNEAQLVVYNRPENAPTVDLPRDKIMFLKTPLIEISSTMIRERLKQNKPVKSLLPAPVYDYICEHGLYR